MNDSWLTECARRYELNILCILSCVASYSLLVVWQCSFHLSRSLSLFFSLSVWLSASIEVGLLANNFFFLDRSLLWFYPIVLSIYIWFTLALRLSQGIFVVFVGFFSRFVFVFHFILNVLVCVVYYLKLIFKHRLW